MPISAAGAVATVTGFGNEADLLDFLIEGVLEKPVELLTFGFNLGDVCEFDLDGSREVVAAVFGQSEIFWNNWR
jgi:hypothetical protein